MELKKGDKVVIHTFRVWGWEESVWEIWAVETYTVQAGRWRFRKSDGRGVGTFSLQRKIVQKINEALPPEGLINSKI